MSMKEAKRLHLVRKAIEKRITKAEVADMAGLCLRQLQRFIRRVRTEGDSGICHRARGEKTEQPDTAAGEGQGNRALPGTLPRWQNHKTRHFCFGKNTTFLLGLDTIPDTPCLLIADDI